jgi:hypothetical protein
MACLRLSPLGYRRFPFLLAADPHDWERVATIDRPERTARKLLAKCVANNDLACVTPGTRRTIGRPSLPRKSGGVKRSARAIPVMPAGGADRRPWSRRQAEPAPSCVACPAEVGAPVIPHTRLASMRAKLRGTLPSRRVEPAGPKLVARFAEVHRSATFVEIGAHDGTRSNCLRPYILSLPWTG